MAGTLISFPSEEASDWTAHIDMFKDLILGYIQCSLTEWDTGTVPQLAAGSKVELNGSYITFGSNESITGSPSSGYINYIYLDSAAYTLSWSTTPPTWSDAKQGWYNGSDRCLGGCYYDGTYYWGKWVYNKGDNILHSYGAVPLIVKVFEIGDWDMSDATGDSTKDLTHGMGTTWYKTVRLVQCMIRRDDDGYVYPLDRLVSTVNGDTVGGVSAITETIINLSRVTGGYFDNADFNSTSYNRGWVTAWYEA